MAPSLLDLKDDTLVEIIANFTVSELSDVASTCTRLKTIARRVFELHHKQNCLDIDARLVDPSVEYSTRRREIGAIFWSFGDLVTKLSVFFYPRTRDDGRNFLNRAVFNLMVIYCTGRLDKLELKWCQHLEKERTIDEAAALFRNVKELILYNSDAIDASFLSDAKQLTKFSLNGYFSMDIVKFLSLDYLSLESLSLSNIYHDLELIDIKNAMKRHKNLTEIELAGRYFDDLSLVDEFPELKKLSVLECNNYDFRLISQLSKLTALNLTTNVDNQSLIEFLNTSKSDQSIEELALRCGFSEDGVLFLQALARFTNIINLSFTFYEKIENTHLEHLQRLEKLRILSIGGSISMTSNSLVLLLNHLTRLERLCLYSGNHLEPMRLRKATYVRICGIYRTRSQTLMIYNFDISDDFYKYAKMKLKKNYVEAKLQKYVQFISMDPGHDYYDDFNYI